MRTPRFRQSFWAFWLLLLSTISYAETFESHFFTLEVPPDWTLSRNLNGLWQYDRQEPFEMSATVLASRLRTSPELYLQGTLELWKTQGETRVLSSGEDSLECLITPPEGATRILKSLRWEKDLLLVTSFTFPVKHTDEAMVSAASFSEGLEFKESSFDPSKLRDGIVTALSQQTNKTEELSDANSVRREMTSFRHDWEPYFAGPKPELFEAFLAYLEARYDAAFVVAYGKEMGMPESLLDSRLTALENSKNEVLISLNSTVETR